MNVHKKAISLLFVFASLFMVVTACTSEGIPSKANSSNIEVEINPESPVVNKETRFTAQILEYTEYEDMRVEVELKKERRNFREVVQMEHLGDGLFTIPYTFTSPDKYFVVVHLWAPGIHEWITEVVQVTYEQ